MNAAARSASAAAAALSIALLAGCATVGAERPMSAGDKLDPWENWNRKVFAFNEELDKYVLKPVATAYRDIVPEFMRKGIGNFFNNAADGWSAVNLFLQGRFEDGLYDTTRFVTNTTFGLFGLLDIASEMGLEHHYEDFGQTLGKWGLGPGAYLVWPVLGPSSVRESAALPLDFMATPGTFINDGGARGALTVVRAINTRADLLGASRVIDEIALDKYTFVRDAYLTRRRSLVYDGDPPEEERDDADPGEAAPPDGAAAQPAGSASAPAR